MAVDSNINNLKFQLRIDVSLDDQERYLQMIMKIDPNDPDFLERNTNNKNYQITLSRKL